MNTKDKIAKVLRSAGRVALLRLGAAGALLFLSAVAAEVFAKRARIRSGSFGGDAYTVGKKTDSKVVFITNMTPVKFSINAIKRK